MVKVRVILLLAGAADIKVQYTSALIKGGFLIMYAFPDCCTVGKK